ncbi:hypothetical protein EA462_06240 [Natrarchaeobius halalkaliphilus]|uniref:Uncharacterized protein n=1 Tax=Natrarchaeobius halalkaliphilus TaxID=1679091 RepID=A0A3N6P6R7_9EURY|nr:hypothetical protein EA462_06240 [Natrarchaeobius halalkaliphilus]
MLLLAIHGRTLVDDPVVLDESAESVSITMTATAADDPLEARRVRQSSNIRTTIPYGSANSIRA